MNHICKRYCVQRCFEFALGKITTAYIDAILVFFPGGNETRDRAIALATEYLNADAASAAFRFLSFRASC